MVFYHENRKVSKTGSAGGERGDGVAYQGTVTGCRYRGPLHPANWREREGPGQVVLKV